MAAWWGAGEYILAACNMDFLQLDTLDVSSRQSKTSGRDASALHSCPITSFLSSEPCSRSPESLRNSSSRTTSEESCVVSLGWLPPSGATPLLAHPISNAPPVSGGSVSGHTWHSTGGSGSSGGPDTHTVVSLCVFHPPAPPVGLKVLPDSPLAYCLRAQGHLVPQPIFPTAVSHSGSQSRPCFCTLPPHWKEL